MRQTAHRPAHRQQQRLNSDGILVEMLRIVGSIFSGTLARLYRTHERRIGEGQQLPNGYEISIARTARKCQQDDPEQQRPRAVIPMF